MLECLLRVAPGQRDLSQNVTRDRLAITGPHQPQQMIFSFGGLAQRALHESEVVMSVARIFVTDKRGFQLLRRGFVFATAIKRKAESDVCRREPGVTFQGLKVSRPRFTFF